MKVDVTYSVSIDGSFDLEVLAGVMFDAISDGEQQDFRAAAAKWIDAVVTYMDAKAEREEESNEMITGTKIDLAYNSREDR
jgi:hypothetical protein